MNRRARFACLLSIVPVVAVGPDVAIQSSVAAAPSSFGIVSVTSAGVPGQSSSGALGLTPFAASPDGSQILFASNSNDLTTLRPSPASTQVYLRDTTLQTTQLVSLNASGSPLNAGVLGFKASHSGRYITYTTLATNVGLGHDNGQANIYRRELTTGQLTWQGTNHDHVIADNGQLYYDAVAVTPDGHYFIPRNTGSVSVTNTQTGITTLAATDANGSPGNGQSFPTIAAISADGRKVTFNSTATNLVPGYISPCAPNNCGAIYQKDMVTGAIVELTSDFANTNSEIGQYVAASDDGSVVAFCSIGSYHASNDGPLLKASAHVYVHSVLMGTTLDAHQDAGQQLNPHSFDCDKAISGDGSTVVVAGNTDFTGCSPFPNCPPPPPMQVYAEPTNPGVVGAAGPDIPVIAPIAPITIQATSTSGAYVNVTPTATDPVDGPVPVTCDSPLPGTYPIGTTTVTCTATNAAAITSAPTAISITVSDIPVIAPIAPITIQATSTSGAYVNVTPTATDPVDGPVPVTCDSPLPGTYPIGTTTVTCIATNAAGISSDPLAVTINVPPTDFVLLSGVVSSAGVGVAGSDVSFGFNSANSSGGLTTTTAADGSYSLRVPTNSTGNLSGNPVLPNGDSIHIEADGLTIGTQDVVENIVLPEPSQIHVQVVDANNAPLTGADFHLQNALPIDTTLADGNPVQFQWNMLGNTGCTTDATGECTRAALAGFTATFFTSYQPSPNDPTFTVTGSQTIDTNPTNITIQFLNIASAPSAGSVSGSVVALTPPGVSLSNLSNSPVAAGQLPAGSFDLTGALSYQVNGVSTGGSVDVVLVLPPGSAPTAVFKIVGGVATDVSSIATIAGDTITVHLTDGGFGDADGLANGVIVDPIVPVRSLAATTTALTSATSTSAYGDPVVVTATVSSEIPGGPVPDGTIDFYDGQTVACHSVPLITGQATCTLSSPNTGAHTISATYPGATWFLASTSAATNISVIQFTPTIDLSSNVGTSVFGQAVTFAVIVPTAGASANVPTGSVGLTDGAVSLCSSVPLASGVATCTVSSLIPGNHQVVATYSGDVNYSSAASPPTVQIVNRASTTSSLIASPGTVVVGGAVTFSTSVATVAPGAGTPGGAVTIYDGLSQACGALVLASGVATCVSSALTVGTHQLVAVYGGDSNYLGSNSVVSTVVVLPAPTTTSISASPSSVVFGQPTTITASVSSASTSTPTGPMVVRDGANVLCSGSVIGGQFSCTTSSLTVGAHSIVAVYSGDASFASSSSGATTINVTTASTTVNVTAAPTNSVFGQLVVLTATVSARSPSVGVPAGPVTFKDGTATLCAAVPLSSGVVTCGVSSLTVGTHSVIASYAGGGGFGSANSVAVAVVVAKTPTTATLTSSANPSVRNQSVTFTASIGTAPSTATATGAVAIKNGTTTLCASVAVTAGQATCTVSTLALGNNPITATFTASGNFLGSTSPTLTQQVTTIRTSTTLTSSVNPTVTGQATVLKATVAAIAPGSGTPAGAATLFDNGIPFAIVILNSQGAASVSRVFATGSHTVTVSYSGAVNYAASSSAALVQNVNLGSTTTKLTTSASTINFGRPVTFSATVAATSPATGTPTGSISFYDGTTLLGTVTINNGSASLSLSTLARGTHTIVARYSGSTGYSTSTSGASTLTVR
jgi:YD repeat-containing protein